MSNVGEITFYFIAHSLVWLLFLGKKSSGGGDYTDPFS